MTDVLERIIEAKKHEPDVTFEVEERGLRIVAFANGGSYMRRISFKCIRDEEQNPLIAEIEEMRRSLMSAVTESGGTIMNS